MRNAICDGKAYKQASKKEEFRASRTSHAMQWGNYETGISNTEQ